jgi:hypothetical protein
MTRLLVAAALLGAALPSAAHPGHGDPAFDGWLHLLSEPRHAVALMAGIALCTAIALLGQRRRASLRAALREARPR